jgi:hypothetical protein
MPKDAVYQSTIRAVLAIVDDPDKFYGKPKEELSFCDENDVELMEMFQSLVDVKDGLSWYRAAVDEKGTRTLQDWVDLLDEAPECVDVNHDLRRKPLEMRLQIALPDVANFCDLLSVSSSNPLALKSMAEYQSMDILQVFQSKWAQTFVNKHLGLSSATPEQAIDLLSQILPALMSGDNKTQLQDILTFATTEMNQNEQKELLQKNKSSEGGYARAFKIYPAFTQMEKLARNRNKEGATDDAVEKRFDDAYAEMEPCAETNGVYPDRSAVENWCLVIMAIKETGSSKLNERRRDAVEKALTITGGGIKTFARNSSQRHVRQMNEVALDVVTCMTESSKSFDEKYSAQYFDDKKKEYNAKLDSSLAQLISFRSGAECTTTMPTGFMSTEEEDRIDEDLMTKKHMSETLARCLDFAFHHEDADGEKKLRGTKAVTLQIMSQCSHLQKDMKQHVIIHSEQIDQETLTHSSSQSDQSLHINNLIRIGD